MTHPSASDVLEKRFQSAARAAKTENVLGDLSGVAHCIFGFLGIVGGALAATAAGAGWPKWLAVLGGVLATVASGAAALFDLERRAEAHWESSAVLRAAAEYVENKRACLGPEADACLS